MIERLQKYMARCGVASRRSCEELIRSGKVQIDGKTVTELGVKVDGDQQKVVVSGELVREEKPLYFAIHKPRGVVCTHSDPGDRPRAVDLVPHEGHRLFPVGRLDEASEGLLLLTNDGQMAHRVAHPRFEMPKVYRVVARGPISTEILEKLRGGVRLPEGKTAPARVHILRKTRETTTLEITLHEGKNRHLRRVLARLELPVKRLLRVRVGPVILGTLKRGQWRYLSREEVVALQSGETEPRERPRRTAAARRSTRGRVEAPGTRKPRPPAATKRPTKKPRRKA